MPVILKLIRNWCNVYIRKTRGKPQVEKREYISYSVLINGLEVNAVYNRDSIEGIFLPLLRKLTKMQT